jgi:tetratricopeptide (TPR) repeat protein
VTPSTADNTGLRKTSNSGIPRLPQLGLAAKPDDTFIEALENFKTASSAGPATIVIPELPDIEVLAEAEPAANQAEHDVAGKLAEARTLIARQQFDAAWRVLERLLPLVPADPRVIMLSANCLANLGQQLEALQQLGHLERVVGQRLGRRLAGPLRAGIRTRAVPGLALQTALLLGSGQQEAAVALLRPYHEADSGGAVFAYLLAGTLSSSDRSQEALDVIDQALRAGAGGAERGKLVELRERTASAVTLGRMGSARSLFLQGRYLAARKALSELDERSRDTQVCRLFDGYLSRLTGQQGRRFGRRPAASKVGAVPPGTPRENDRLYFFLVGDLVAQASRELAADELEAANATLDRALRLCPGFPYANYLRGNCLYAQAAKLAAGKDGAVAEKTILSLYGAQSAMSIATSDPDIGTSAKEALAVLDSTLQPFDRAGGRDLVVINPLIGDFNDLVSGVGSGADSDLGQFRDSLFQQKKRITQARERLTTPQGERRLRELESQVEQHLQSLDTAKTVRSLFERYDRAMKGWEANPISSRAELDAAITLIGQLRRDVKRSRAAQRDAQASKELDKLLGAIDRVQQQLSSVRG